MNDGYDVKRGDPSDGRPCCVLDLRDSPWVDGPGRTILDTASMIDPERYRITIGAFSGCRHNEHDYLKEARRRELDVCPIPERRAFDLAVLRHILGWSRENRIDIIHTHDFRSDVYGYMAGRMLGIPVIATCHGWIANNSKGRLFTWLDKKFMRRFDRVIVVSRKMRAQLIGAGVPDRKIVVIQNALVVDQYRPDRADTRIRRELGIPEGHKVVANIGRLSAEKCQDLYLRSAAMVLRTHPDTFFLLIGIGPDEGRLRGLCEELGIAGKVRFTGYREDMRDVYNAIDLVVQSSRTEGMPNVVLEALLMRVPVVATDVGGTAEIIQDGITGRLLPPNDLDAMSLAISHALSSMETMQSWTELGERHVRSMFNHDRRLRLIAETYDSVKRMDVS